MRHDRKIPLSELQERLQARLHYKKPEVAFRTLLLCWLKHPRFKSPSRTAFNARARTDGFFWLKDEEVPSFEAYCGYRLR